MNLPEEGEALQASDAFILGLIDLLIFCRAKAGLVFIGNSWGGNADLQNKSRSVLALSLRW